MITIRNPARIDSGHRFGSRPQRSLNLRWPNDEPRRTSTGWEDEHGNDGRAADRPDENERADGGTSDTEPDEDDEFAVYTDGKYGYRMLYPAEWSVKAEPTGEASFDALTSSDAGAVVFVDEDVEGLETYVEGFVADLRADEHVDVSEPMTRREVRLESGQPGRVIDSPYVDDTSTETLRFVYLFAVVDGTGYTLGIDWSEDDPFGDVAERVVESFAVGGESGNERTRKDGQTE